MTKITRESRTRGPRAITNALTMVTVLAKLIITPSDPIIGNPILLQDHPIEGI
jgi:hypothetical protein